MPIRLIILHQDKKFSNIQWEAISALESHKEWITTSEQLDISSDNARIQLVKDLTKQEVLDEQSEILAGNSIIDAPIHHVQFELQTLLDALANGTQKLEDVENKIRELYNAA
ncbi:MAG: hypothetical protein LQ351_007823 [Letrouitia transgressa]|nr:MAG: hypothetical protein LQ351_007823 [Letrouitia transgressa]